MTSFFKRVALTAIITAIGTLAVSTPASADVTPVVNGNTLTVTGGVDPDSITLAAAGGFITVNRGATTLQSGANAEIVVNANGGNDTVDATALTAADYGALAINGGDGDDALTGGAGVDGIHGDSGNDRLVGFKGNDAVLGGDGNDVMVWNNGDASDVNNGDAGVDEVEVNGSPTAGDEFVANADPPSGRALFTRINLVPFAIDLSAERLTVNGLGGDDGFSPNPGNPNAASQFPGVTSLTLSGGSGADRLVGGDGSDVINGGDGDDQLQGGGGDDRLTGDRGSDKVFGDAGDDALVWNNGDGSDQNFGDAGFDRAEVNGSPAAGDAFKLSPNGANAKFERTNLVPFTIDLAAGGVEAVAVSGGGGDDQLVVAPGLPGLLVVADGDAGNDTLTGSEENDGFSGGAGNDVLNPGGATDSADGGEGDDQLFTRDGAVDLVQGGAGTDRAQTDAVTVDSVSGVEALDATAVVTNTVAPIDTAALVPTLGKVKVTRSNRQLVARVPVSCSNGEAGGCRTTLTVETAKPIRLGKVRAVLVLGSRRVTLRRGQRSTVSIRLAAGAATLAKRRKLATRVRITSSDAAGNSAARSVALRLTIPRR